MPNMKIALLAAVIGLSFALTACSKDPKQDAASEPTAGTSQAAVDDSNYSDEDTQPLDAAPLEDAEGNVIEPASEPASEPQAE